MEVGRLRAERGRHSGGCGRRRWAGVGSEQLWALMSPGNLTRRLPRKTAVRVGDTAMFCVELARPVGPVHWLRNQEEMVAGGRVAITTEGTCHTLTISQCRLEDVGQVAFVAGDCRTSTQFCVSGEDLGTPSMCRAPSGPSVLRASALPSAGCREDQGGWGTAWVAAVLPWYCVLLPQVTARWGSWWSLDCSRREAWGWGVLCKRSLSLWPLVPSCMVVPPPVASRKSAFYEGGCVLPSLARESDSPSAGGGGSQLVTSACALPSPQEGAPALP